ncbi:MAG: GTPase Era [Anaerolineales bacterium]|nr:GTPase Era [Anaerolineales bacterium]
MHNQTSPLPYRSGFVTVVGRPNVGKSTLINALLKQKIAAVSPRPQTTRITQFGILTRREAQIIFIDTPGVHHPRHKLGEKMNEKALQTLEECDLILLLVDASLPPDEDDRLLAAHLASLHHPARILLVLNKVDLLNHDEREERAKAFAELAPGAESIQISAIRSENLEALTDLIASHLPEHPPFFPEEQLTDLYERDLAGDLIREAALRLLRDEVPHGIAVRLDQYTERGEGGAYIEATLFVERESHKGIVIGQGGTMLKQIGSLARKEIEEMSGRKVYLRLRVKVRKNWRNDEKVLRWFGYS